MYLHRVYFQANVDTIWVHGPLGNKWAQDLAKDARRVQSAISPSPLAWLQNM